MKEGRTPKGGAKQQGQLCKVCSKKAEKEATGVGPGPHWERGMWKTKCNNVKANPAEDAWENSAC